MERSPTQVGYCLVSGGHSPGTWWRWAGIPLGFVGPRTEEPDPTKCIGPQAVERHLSGLLLVTLGTPNPPGLHISPSKVSKVLIQRKSSKGPVLRDVLSHHLQFNITNVSSSRQRSTSRGTQQEQKSGLMGLTRFRHQKSLWHLDSGQGGKKQVAGMGEQLISPEFPLCCSLSSPPVSTYPVWTHRTPVTMGQVLPASLGTAR